MNFKKKPTKLDETIDNLIKQINESESGSEEQERLVGELSELLKTRHEIKPDWWWKITDRGIQVASIVLPMIGFAKMLDVCMKFETEGVITSTATKALLKFIKPVLK